MSVVIEQRNTEYKYTATSRIHIAHSAKPSESHFNLARESREHFSHYTPQFENIVGNYGLGLNEAWNKMDISSIYHYSKHPNAYHDFVLRGMRDADAGAAGNVNTFLQLFDDYVKQPLLQNPNMLNKTGW